jgi:hypothetical protein
VSITWKVLLAKDFFQPCPDFIMAAGHHQLQPFRLEEKKNNPDAARDSKLKNVVSQVAQTQAAVGMRLPKGFPDSDGLALQSLSSYAHYTVSSCQGSTLSPHNSKPIPG